jgi:hypothetical protein
MAYLCQYYELENNIDLVIMQQREKAYQIMNNDMYKTSVMGPLLRYLSKAEGRKLFLEIHAGSYGCPMRARALAAKVLRQGIYWPLVIDDISKIVTTCEACQKFSHQSKAPSQPSQLIMPPWPLQRWGIDIVGPLPMTQGKYKYIVVAVEYLTKWIEANETSDQFNLHHNQEIFLAKHHLSIWGTKANNSRQRKTS